MISVIGTVENLAGGDIYIFLTKADIDELDSKTLEGILFNSKNLKVQQEINVCVDKSILDNFCLKDIESGYHISINKDYYRELKEKERIGGSVGNFFKIDVMSENYASNENEFKFALKSVKEWHEHKDKLK